MGERGRRACSPAPTSTRSATQADEQLLRTRVEGVPLRDTALILYTSGTTSNPRGAMLSHEAFVRTWMVTAPHLGHERRRPHVERAAAVPRDRARHGDLGAGQGRDVLSATTRSTPTRTRRHAARREDHAVLPRLPAGDRGRARAPGLRPTPTSARSRLAQTSRRRRCWGSSRSACRTPSSSPSTAAPRAAVVTMTRRDDPLEVRLNTCGACQPGLELRVVDAIPAQPLGPGERGIIQFRGYNTLSGYWKAPEKTAESDARGRLGDDAGPRRARRGGPRAVPRPRQGDAEGRRRERRAARDRGAALDPPRGQARVGRRHPRPAAGRGPGRRSSSWCPAPRPPRRS